MSLRFHEITESRHRILNPFTHEQLILLGEICRLHDGMRQLDLCCGKGEMLCRWSARYGLRNRDSLLLVGEPYWSEQPPGEARAAITGGDRDLFTSLDGTLERIEAAGLELVKMVLADLHGWDRYVAQQWLTVSDWLRANPDSPEAAEIRAIHQQSRRDHLRFQRRYLGWGVFVLRST